MQVATSPDAALRDPTVDGVVICTPTVTHHALAKAALEAGKHVLVEKPITTRSDQGEELCRLAKANGLVLMVGHIFLYNAAVRFVKRSIDAGELGRIYYVSMVRTNLGPIRVDVNAAWDLAAHDIAIVDYWLGGSARSVSATGGTWINPGIEDSVFATLRYADDVLVSLHASWLNPRKAREITVVGERRMVTVDDMNLGEPVRIYDKRVTEARVQPKFVDTFASFRASVRDGDITIPRVSSGEPLEVECDHFLECITYSHAAAHGRAVGGSRGQDAGSDHAFDAQPWSRGAGLTGRQDSAGRSRAQHRQIADEVSAGFARVMERASFILGDEVAEFEASLRPVRRSAALHRRGERHRCARARAAGARDRRGRRSRRSGQHVHRDRARRLARGRHARSSSTATPPPT